MCLTHSWPQHQECKIFMFIFIFACHVKVQKVVYVRYGSLFHVIDRKYPLPCNSVSMAHTWMAIWSQSRFIKPLFRKSECYPYYCEEVVVVVVVVSIHKLTRLWLNIFRSVSLPHWQWPAPSDSWLVTYITEVSHHTTSREWEFMHQSGGCILWSMWLAW